MHLRMFRLHVHLRHRHPNSFSVQRRQRLVPYCLFPAIGPLVSDTTDPTCLNPSASRPQQAASVRPPTPFRVSLSQAHPYCPTAYGSKAGGCLRHRLHQVIIHRVVVANHSIHLCPQNVTSRNILAQTVQAWRTVRHGRRQAVRRILPLSTLSHKR